MSPQRFIGNLVVEVLILVYNSDIFVSIFLYKYIPIFYADKYMSIKCVFFVIDLY